MTNGPILLEYNFNAGDILHYKSTIETKQGTTQHNKTSMVENKIEIIYRWHVVEFLNGVYKLEISAESGTLTQNNVVQKMPPVDKPIFSFLKKSGEIVSEETQQQISQQAFPGHPINIGDVWESREQTSFPGNPEPVMIINNNTFENIENINGFECAYLKTECPVSKFEMQPGVTLALEIKGQIHFAFREGLPIKSLFKTTTELIAPQIQQNGERIISMELVEINGKSLLT